MRTETTNAWNDAWNDAPFDELLLVCLQGDDGGKRLTTGYVYQNPETNDLWFCADDNSEWLVLTSTGDPVETARNDEWPVAWCHQTFPF